MTLDIESGIRRPKIDMHCHVWLMDGWEQSADHLVASGDMLGITEYWCSSVIQQGILAPFADVPPHNDTILRAMARHPKRIRGWCFVIPGHFQDAIDEAERCLDAGMIGIKLYNQYRIDDPVLHPYSRIGERTPRAHSSARGVPPFPNTAQASRSFHTVFILVKPVKNIPMRFSFTPISGGEAIGNTRCAKCGRRRPMFISMCRGAI